MEKLQKITFKDFTQAAVKGATTNIRNEIIADVIALGIIGVGTVIYNKYVDCANSKIGVSTPTMPAK